MRPTRTRPFGPLLAVTLAVLLATGGLAGPALATTAAAQSDSVTAAPGSSSALAADSAAVARTTSAATQDDRPANPTTEDTIGYVAGYWYDDDLPVDNQSTAVVAEDELDPVVYRAMARVERIRNLTFDDRVSVDVISREEYRETNGDRFANISSGNRLEQNVGYEALFTVGRNTTASDAAETVYGGAVAGYYDPETDEIVIVSENTDTPELNELTLGHELVHALQDQRFNLSQLEGTTQDGETARNGLVEGDASRVEREYEHRCGTEWDCLEPADGPSNGGLDINWGIYFSVYQPYSDGPDYVNYLRDQGEGWSAVNAAYDDPPTTTSAVIHPGSAREPANVSVPDRSSGDWRQLRVDGETANDTVGEAGMVAMFAADALDSARPSVINSTELLQGTGSYDYNHSYTNGWAGDELVVYTNDEVENTSDPAAAAGRAGYVWRTQWQSNTDTQQFVNGYLRLLENHDAEPVDGRQDTYVIDEDGGYAGAYYLNRTGQTLTIVRAPSVDELPTVEAGAAPEGEDTLEITDSSGTGTDTVPGFGPLAAVSAIAIAVLGVGTRIVIGRGRTGGDRRE
ncbi:Hvo_1808 family surface protein [Natrinema versiforme]|uniref:PGF-CTERM sorting domain-containing protein n=1 Tax=Natrinema versiforme JCM 10478 TaxID=1227496 RepID=L9XTG5_9EURY|nr:Hvo_1808 family surface protein [Natrinema versiforme]ELY64686.1 hypothetical protein C489_16505 [Natrinema versiforme JCM 10478]